jgi:hypothetical protein
MLKRFVSFVVAAALVVLPSTALAHQVGLSRGTYARAGNVVHADVTLARGDAATLGLTLETNPTDLVAVGDCAGRIASLEPTAADGLEMRAEYTCPDASARSIDVKLVETLGGGHRHLAHAGVSDYVLKEGDAHLSLDAGTRTSPSFAKLVALGVEHIWTGWDHLLFLFGLLLLSPRVRSLGLTISAFTLAHSITLGLAAFGVWTPSAAIVEPAIALSIAWVGVENVRALVARRADGVAAARWRITFPFGLVHGFGFAAALRDLGMSRADVPKALLGFNLGVELGQLAVVIPLALALAWFVRRNKLPARAISFASAAIVVIGVALFVARVA